MVCRSLKRIDVKQKNMWFIELIGDWLIALLSDVSEGMLRFHNRNPQSNIFPARKPCTREGVMKKRFVKTRTMARRNLFITHLSFPSR